VQEITEVTRWWNDDWLNYYASEIAAFTSPKKEHTTEMFDSQVDGSAFETRTISAVAKGDQKSWKRVLTIHEDITFRHQMEDDLPVNQNLLERLVQERTDKLVASEEYYKTLVDTANAPIFGIDARGKINGWNQQAEQITGYTKQEVLDKDLVENFITAEYKASVGDVLANALKGEETANYEFPLFTKSWHRVDALLNSTTLRDATGDTACSGGSHKKQV
jgi:PAS domain S-box-containing protein